MVFTISVSVFVSGRESMICLTRFFFFPSSSAVDLRFAGTFSTLTRDTTGRGFGFSITACFFSFVIDAEKAFRNLSMHDEQRS